MLAYTSIDSLYPQCAKITLPGSPIAVGILKVFLNTLIRCTERIFRPSTRTFRRLDYFSVPSVFNYAPTYPCHCRPFLAYPKIISLHRPRVARRHDLGAPIATLHFLRPTAQHMIKVGTGKAYHALCCQTKAFFGTALIFELGHLAILNM